MVSSFVGGVKFISEVFNTRVSKKLPYTHTIWHPFDVLSNQMGARSTNN